MALGLVVVALLVVAGSSAIWALRSWVIRPLAGLRDDVREVAGGELDHPVRVAGPPDLVELAQDVDSMRQRIVSEVRLLAEASSRSRGLSTKTSAAPTSNWNSSLTSPRTTSRSP